MRRARIDEILANTRSLATHGRLAHEVSQSKVAGAGDYEPSAEGDQLRKLASDLRSLSDDDIRLEGLSAVLQGQRPASYSHDAAKLASDMEVVIQPGRTQSETLRNLAQACRDTADTLKTAALSDGVDILTAYTALHSLKLSMV